jgi:hypothetical protein
MSSCLDVPYFIKLSHKGRDIQKNIIENKIRILISRRFHKILESEYYLRQLRLSVGVEQLGSHWTDLIKHDIFRKSVEKIQVSLKSDKNNGYLT